ncbi:MAG: type I restriction enzyme HsdR N-terminal domain-containing protein [Planctomycetaceae bacterium]|nr:type I restriction enzyme HsdR N-terminal domain-containing protein [Planctomycetaceae bacterium]
MTWTAFFPNVDFAAIAANPEFKEASVRAFIIDPLLQKLGYTADSIVHEKIVQIRIGSKKQTTPYYADYVLKIGNSYVCVIEAKAPDKNIAEHDAVDQALTYAMHNEIRSKYFAICNGVEFALYRTDIDRTLLLRFLLSEIDQYWNEFKRYLAPESFQDNSKIQQEKEKDSGDFDLTTHCRKMLLNEIPCKKQGAKRHFGCTAYFTRQTWNVVQGYIQNYSRPGDLVLDPFGGSGITAVEALMVERKGVHIDLNPLSPFIVNSLIAPVNVAELNEACNAVCKEYEKLEPKTKAEIKAALQKYKQPKDLPLPKNSDVKSVWKLFSLKQRAQLSLLKALIKKQKDKNIRQSLLLAFYNTLTICNLTFHETPKGGGNHFGFYYRYRVAREPANRNTVETFKNKVQRVIDGKQEMAMFNYADRISDITIKKGTATDLSHIESESVDYIYTDPPYGKKIQYLDLSAMWNAWLDLDVSDEDYQLEAIEEGKLDKTKDEYKKLIAGSIKEMFRVLKYDRWLTFVYAHKDPDFFDLIKNTAEQCGFEYVGAVPQKNGQSSFKKRQRPGRILSGQLMLNFRKVRNPKTMLKVNLGSDMTLLVLETIEGIIAKHNGATLEQINDTLIQKGLELGFLDLLEKTYEKGDITPLLEKEFVFDEKTELFMIPPHRSFKTHIDLHLRIKYYLTSYLVRSEREHKDARFDDIVLTILPSLKNGSSPEEQTILGVLQDIAVPYGTDCWRLKKDGQGELIMEPT